jgi:hypothetical protein
MVAALAWACHPMEGRRRPADSGNLFAVWPRKPLLELPPSRLCVQSRSSLCGGPSELTSMVFRKAISVEGLSPIIALPSSRWPYTDVQS